MPQKRCLVIGASGQLGRALRLAFKESTSVLEAYRTPTKPDQVRIDLSDPTGTREKLEELKPHWILIAGAFCNVDLCETQREICWKVNVEGPAAVCEYASRRGARVVYYSTDQVFDGEKSFTETDAVQPVNVYASSKVGGERIIRESLPNHHLILRTTCLYGPDDARKNFVLRLVDRLAQGKETPVPNDQWAAPTYTEDLAALTRFLLERGERGLFHATGSEFMSRPEWALRICEAFGLNPSLIVPPPTPQLGQPARRPMGVRLDCQKLNRLDGPGFRKLDDGLKALLRWTDAESSCFDSRSHP